MHVIAAPDSFKGSIDAAEAAEAIARGAESAGAGVTAERCPVADGGEGTARALVEARGGEMRAARVTGPLGESVEARWGLIDGGATAVIEMAQAAGLGLVPEGRRDPRATTTFGVGQLIAEALDAGVKRIIVGLGGSATTDGGAGMAQALGVRFTDAAGRRIQAPITGGGLEALGGIDPGGLDPRLAGVEVAAATDVTNPLTGAEGAAAVYGPQKGADPEGVRALERGLAHLARLLGADPTTPGTGAAGGLGLGLVHLCGGSLTSGVELVLDAVGLDRRLAGAGLVLTGEGRLDGQSAGGKACGGVARAAAGRGVPAVALVGSVGEGAPRMYARGLCAWFCICDGPMPLAESRARAAPLLEQAARNAVRCRLGRSAPAT